MSPEQVRGAEDMDHRADVYALGAILYEALTGLAAHPGKTQHEIISHVLFGKVAEVRRVNPAVPVELGRAVHKALASKPDDRFQSAAAFAASIAPFLGSGELPAVLSQDGSDSPTLPGQSSDPGTSDRAERQSSTPAEPAAAGHVPAHGRPVLAHLWILVAVSCTAIAMIWALRREESPVAGSEAQSRPRELPSHAEIRSSDEIAAPTISEPTAIATTSRSTEANPASQRNGASVSASPVRRPPAMQPATRQPGGSGGTSPSNEPEHSGLEVHWGERSLQFKGNPFPQVAGPRR
jgi:hypothetical protein